METLNDLTAALLQLTLGQKLPADLRLQGEPGGLTRALHPILIVTVKAKQVLVQDNQLHSLFPNRPPRSARAREPPGQRVCAGTEGRVCAVEVPPHSSLESVLLILQTRFWVTFPFNMKGLS